MEAMLKALALGDRGLGSSIGLGGKPCPSLYHYATVKHIHATCLLHCPRYLACCTVHVTCVAVLSTLPCLLYCPRCLDCCTVHAASLLYCPRYLLVAVSTCCTVHATSLLHWPRYLLVALSTLPPCCTVHATLLDALPTLPCLLHCPPYLGSVPQCPRYLSCCTVHPILLQCCNVHATCFLHCPHYLACCSWSTRSSLAINGWRLGDIDPRCES